MINRIKAKIFTQKITGSILGAPVQNIGGFDRIIFCHPLPDVGQINILYVDTVDLFQYVWNGTAFESIQGGAIEMRIDSNFIQWRYGAGSWVNLISLDLLKGADGTNGTNGIDGQDGEDGTPIELQVANNILQWRYVGGTTWTNLIDFSTLTPRHSQLRGLDWLGSGHTGTANKLFGSDANGLAKEYTPCLLVTSSASSGTINLGVNTTTVLSTVLSSSHTITVTPTAPTDFTTTQLAQLDFTTATTTPSITLTAPSGVTFKWRHTEITSWKASKTYTIQFVWISSTRCDIYYLIS